MVREELAESIRNNKQNEEKTQEIRIHAESLKNLIKDFEIQITQLKSSRQDDAKQINQLETHLADKSSTITRLEERVSDLEPLTEAIEHEKLRRIKVTS